MNKYGTKLGDAFAEEKARAEYEKEKVLDNVDSSELIAVLYKRGVKFSTIFGQYYEMEEMDNARTMTVEDAILAGYDGITINRKEAF